METNVIRRRSKHICENVRNPVTCVKYCNNTFVVNILTVLLQSSRISGFSRRFKMPFRFGKSRGLKLGRSYISEVIAKIILLLRSVFVHVCQGIFVSYLAIKRAVTFKVSYKRSASEYFVDLRSCILVILDV